MADELGELLSASVQSDLELFGNIFGNFELYMPDLSDDEANNPGPDISSLLELPNPEQMDDPNSTVSSNPVQSIQDPIPEPNQPVCSQIKQETHVPKEDQSQLKTEPHSNQNERFKKLTTSELETMKDNKYAQKTKSNTKWGVNLFQG